MTVKKFTHDDLPKRYKDDDDYIAKHPTTKFKYGKICKWHPEVNGLKIRKTTCPICEADSKKLQRRVREPEWVLMRINQARLRNILKKIGEGKTVSAKELLGCTDKEYKAYMEKLFKPGMTWENRGKNGWHVDHIRPCSSFDLRDPVQLKACFHYTNLQPLWWYENLAKGDKYDPHGLQL